MTARGTSNCNQGKLIGSGLFSWRIFSNHIQVKNRSAPRTDRLNLAIAMNGNGCLLRINYQANLSATLMAGLPRNKPALHGFFPHRALAAFAAIAERFFGPSAAALAAPPFSPPKRPRATAAGFFFFTSGASVLVDCPVDSSMIRYASSLGSRGRIFERSGIMLPVCERVTA